MVSAAGLGGGPGSREGGTRWPDGWAPGTGHQTRPPLTRSAPQWLGRQGRPDSLKVGSPEPQFPHYEQRKQHADGLPCYVNNVVKRKRAPMCETPRRASSTRTFPTRWRLSSATAWSRERPVICGGSSQNDPGLDVQAWGLQQVGSIPGTAGAHGHPSVTCRPCHRHRAPARSWAWF